MEKPRIKISIIIPYHNDKKLILEAIESVETYPDKSIYEIIIVNDGSKDPESIETLSQLSSKGYQIINQDNKGLGGARNSGIKAAKGEYILPLDSDNKIKKEYITEAIAILDANPLVGVVYGNPEFFGAEMSTRKWDPTSFNANSLKFGNSIDACAIYRKLLWDELGGYDEKMPWMGTEDWEFWIRVTRTKYTFHWINKSLFYYRVSDNSMITGFSLERVAENFGYIVKKNPDLYAFFFKDYIGTYHSVVRLSPRKHKLLNFILRILKKVPL